MNFVVWGVLSLLLSAVVCSPDVLFVAAQPDAVAGDVRAAAFLWAGEVDTAALVGVACLLGWWPTERRGREEMMRKCYTLVSYTV